MIADVPTCPSVGRFFKWMVERGSVSIPLDTSRSTRTRTRLANVIVVISKYFYKYFYKYGYEYRKVDIMAENFDHIIMDDMALSLVLGGSHCIMLDLVVYYNSLVKIISFVLVPKVNNCTNGVVFVVWDWDWKERFVHLVMGGIALSYSLRQENCMILKMCFHSSTFCKILLFYLHS